MKLILFLIVFFMVGMTRPNDPCPPPAQILLGMTYNEIKAGPCPDIEGTARPHIDPFHPIYYCPSLHEMVIANVGPNKSGTVISVSIYIDK